jgi:4-amino-4-deoxy-L-arabinose transferase-like glycosyltransferase
MLTLVILLGTILRLYGLTVKPLWYDETGFIAHALKDLGFMSHAVANYKLPYIILLKIWISFFGIGAFATRILSVLLGIASIFLIYQLGKRLFNTSTALIASFLLSISSFHIYHSQQVKHYSLLVFLVLLSFIYLVDFFKGRKSSILLLNLLLNILIVCTHPFGLSIVAVQMLYVLCAHRTIDGKQLKEWFYFQLPLAFFLGLWAWVLFAGRNNLRAILWWVQPPATQNLMDTFSTFIYGGPAYGLSSLEHVSFPPVITGVLMLMFCFFFVRGLVLIFCQEAKSHQVFVVIWLALPIALSFLFSYLFFPVYLIKNFLIFLPAFYLIVARGIAYRRPWISGVILVAVLLLNIVPLRAMFRAKINVDWEKAVHFVKRHEVKDDDIFIIVTTKEIVSFMYYLGGADRAALKDVLIFGKFENNLWQESFQYKDHFIITLGSERYAGKDEYRDFGAGSNILYNSDYIVSDFDKKVMRHEDIIKSHRQIWILISRWAGTVYDNRVFVDKLNPYYELTLAKEVKGIKIFRFSPRS